MGCPPIQNLIALKAPVAKDLSPFQGFPRSHQKPTAYAVGFILAPLRGSSTGTFTGAVLTSSVE